MKKTDQETVYVVTRQGRRTEEKNYSSKADANFRAESLKILLKEWDPAQVNSVSVVKTDKPYRIR